MALKEFPEQISLRDGTPVTLRPMVESDGAALLAFFLRLPPEDRQFLRDDVTRPELIHAWCQGIDYNRVLPILAECEGRIVGDATLHRRPGWMCHLGEIRVVTRPVLSAPRPWRGRFSIWRCKRGLIK